MFCVDLRFAHEDNSLLQVSDVSEQKFDCYSDDLLWQRLCMLLTEFVGSIWFSE
jgi:hypothetical protein